MCFCKRVKPVFYCNVRITTMLQPAQFSSWMTQRQMDAVQGQVTAESSRPEQTWTFTVRSAVPPVGGHTETSLPAAAAACLMSCLMKNPASCGWATLFWCLKDFRLIDKTQNGPLACLLVRWQTVLFSLLFSGVLFVSFIILLTLIGWNQQHQISSNTSYQQTNTVVEGWWSVQFTVTEWTMISCRPKSDVSPNWVSNRTCWRFCRLLDKVLLGHGVDIMTNDPEVVLFSYFGFWGKDEAEIWLTLKQNRLFVQENADRCENSCKKEVIKIYTFI